MSGFASSLWRRSDDAQSGSTVFRRPLGETELKFYWDTVFYGVAITITHVVLEADAASECELFTKENIELTWMRLKQRFPMLAASVDELPGSETVEFVLDERALYSIRSGEVNLVDDLESKEDVVRMTDRLQNGQPMLPNKVIAKLWIGPQKDTPRQYHAFIAAVHYITDGMAGATLMRELCQELASLSKEDRILGKPLAERLTALLPLEALNPSNELSRARRRWRSAAAKIIHNLRQAKLTGGHTLPVLSPVGFGTPALSRTTTLRLPADVSQQVIRTCRALGITFGNALPVLSQLAHSRVLHRRRRSGNNQMQPKISDEEWEYRRVQPMRFAGPLNLRPYLDRAWYEAGGAAEVCLAISFYDLVLPSMPSPISLRPGLSNFASTQQQPQSLARWLAGSRDIDCFLSEGPATDPGDPYEIYETGDPIRTSSSTSSDEDGAPSFSALLSHQRFLARARMACAQSTALLRHPLLQELHAARMPEFHRRARAAGLAWRAKQAGQNNAESGSIDVPNRFSKTSGCVITNGGASLGNRDLIFPLDYPIHLSSARRSSPIRLHVRDSIIHLRCRPGELYLGALTTRGELTFFTYADAHVHDPELVREWVEDVRAATVHYLGGGSNDASSDESENADRENKGAFRRAKL